MLAISPWSAACFRIRHLGERGEENVSVHNDRAEGPEAKGLRGTPGAATTTTTTTATTPADQECPPGAREQAPTGTVIRELEALVAVTDSALAHLTTEEVLRAVLERLRATLGVDNVLILLLDAAGTGWTVRAIHGLEEDLAIGVHLPFRSGVATQIARSRQPVVVDDVSRAQVRRPALRKRLRSLAGVPLMVGGRVTGVVHVGTIQPHHFTHAAVQLL